MIEYSRELQIKVARKYLKLKIIEDNVTFRGHSVEQRHVYNLIANTIINGESHSALVIGPRGSGKTTLINSTISSISKEVDIVNDAIIVRLSGLLHHDDKVALKSITAQMQLENAVGDRVFGTFAENLAFLLSCLQSGSDRRCKSMVFILDEFDMFCHAGKTQTLLYNLFDITHSKQAPMCVIGLTNRLDVIELLEKRVKSRFSHRHIFLFPTEDSDVDAVQAVPAVNIYLDVFTQLLSLPKIEKRSNKRKKDVQPMDIEGPNTAVPLEVLRRCKVDASLFQALDQEFVGNWNAHIKSLSEDSKVVDAIEKFCYYTVNEQIFKDVLFQIVSRLSPKKLCFVVEDITSTIDKAVGSEHRIMLLQSLSILELSLVIAMKHGMEIFDGQPLNFEMILHRYTKFANANSTTQSVPRPVILKAFEHLQALEIIIPVRGDSAGSQTTGSRVQKEYQLFALAVPVDDIHDAVKGFKALPTEITHWCNNSIF